MKPNRCAARSLKPHRLDFAKITNKPQTCKLKCSFYILQKPLIERYRSQTRQGGHKKGHPAVEPKKSKRFTTRRTKTSFPDKYVLSPKARQLHFLNKVVREAHHRFSVSLDLFITPQLRYIWPQATKLQDKDTFSCLECDLLASQRINVELLCTGHNVNSSPQNTISRNSCFACPVYGFWSQRSSSNAPKNTQYGLRFSVYRLRGFYSQAHLQQFKLSPSAAYP